MDDVNEAPALSGAKLKQRRSAATRHGAQSDAQINDAARAHKRRLLGAPSGPDRDRPPASARPLTAWVCLVSLGESSTSEGLGRAEFRLGTRGSGWDTCDG